jgi:SET domain-containing protein
MKKHKPILSGKIYFCMPTSVSRPITQRAPRCYAVRKSGIHGKGVFATVVIPKGTRIIEYKGQHLSSQEADARYGPNAKMEIVLLFAVDESTVIDASVRGNSARFINHSCSPNCLAVMEDGRIFIEALRQIKPGKELFYDYGLELDALDKKKSAKLYPCHCGSRKCRGTLAAP